MVESRLPVPLSRSEVATDTWLPRLRRWQWARYPAARALAGLSAELAPDLVRLARRALRSRSRALRRHEASDTLARAEVTITEMRIKVLGPAQGLVMHKTSIWSTPLHDGRPHAPAVRRIGLGLVGLAGALVLLRVASGRRLAQLPLPRRLAE